MPANPEKPRVQPFKMADVDAFIVTLQELVGDAKGVKTAMEKNGKTFIPIDGGGTGPKKAADAIGKFLGKLQTAAKARTP